MDIDHEKRIAEAIGRDQSRLRAFIRRRVPDASDAEDILQDVFYQLLETFRLVRPVERIGPWLFRVARNRIADLYRSRKPDASTDDFAGDQEVDSLTSLADMLPSPEAGPEAAYARRLLLEELDDALEELPEEQREVFVAHEFEGLSFKELSAATGLSINTLLSRKHYAVLHLRKRLRAIYDELAKG